MLAYFVLYFGYFALFEVLWNGQTPGKKKEGLRVIKDDGRPITPAEAIGRNLDAHLLTSCPRSMPLAFAACC